MDFGDVKKAGLAYQRKIRQITIISVAIFLVLILYFLVAYQDMAGAVFYGIVFGLTIYMVAYVLAFMYASKELAEYRRAYKAYFVEKNLAKTFTILKYDHKLGLGAEMIRKTGMMTLGDRFSSNDYTAGLYKDVGFVQADVHIQKKRQDEDGQANYSTIFKGRWMIFEFPKAFNFRIEVVEKGFRGNLIPRSQQNRKFEKMKLESPEFNKLFRLYAEDGFEAFYLMDPAIINNITELGREYKGKLLLCFIDNKLHVGLHDNKDAFEPPSAFKRLDEKVENEKIAREIHLITNFIDKLKLDRKLFKG